MSARLVPVVHQPPPGVTLSTVPTLRGRQAAHAWVRDVLGVPVTRNFFHRAVHNREVQCKKMSGALFFSTQALFDWVMARYDEAAS